MSLVEGPRLCIAKLLSETCRSGFFAKTWHRLAARATGGWPSVSVPHLPQ
jgi:hypothetical protein